ncbi:MAG: PP2C family protein-serine/threonine phosphatase, partial [bacterium]|nr:PP2C family protein-serine/threonine phosphatase [bacterium]
FGVGVFFFLAPGILFGIWCFYIFLLAADQGAHLDEAFVESRKAVRRYGFWKHLLLAVVALGLVVGGLLAVKDMVNGSAFEVSPLVWLVPVLIQPLGLGIFASAYFRTLAVEARQRELHEHEFKVMRNELQTAHDMQMDLLPSQSPEIEGYSLGGVCIPANNVGGDYFAYRWLDLDQTRLALVAADVSGKAMEAAVTALRFNEMLRYECRGRISPAEILDGLDDSLDGQIDPTTFVTCCIAVLNVQEGKVEVANAGHCLPFHYSAATGQVASIHLTGYPLGLPAAIRLPEGYGTIQVALEPGDALILYSDGIVEAQNASSEFYGEDRFAELLTERVPEADAERLIHAVVKDVDHFIGNAPRSDDMTVVVLRRQV